MTDIGFKPFVSIMMITYNHEPYIAQALDRVLKQKVDFPFEIVIGEDCSTDNTRRIVDGYKNRFPEIVRIISSEKNVGVRKNFYRTIVNCKGKYISFCEGDDYWHDEKKLQLQTDYLEKHTDYGMVFSDCNVYNEKKGSLSERVRYHDGYREPADFTIDQIVGDWRLMRWPWTCTATARTELVQEIKNRDSYLHQSPKFLMGDLQLFAELAHISRVHYMPISLSTYRELPESASNSNDLKRHLVFWISASEVRLYLCRKHNLPDEIWKKAENVWCEKALYMAFLERNHELANEVRKVKKHFNWKEWLRYYGSHNKIVHYLYKLALIILKTNTANKR